MLLFKRRSLLASLCVLTIPAVAIFAQSTAGRLYIVAHVDATPNFATQTAKLLQTYGADTRKDPGALRIDVLVESGRKNHFTLIEVWESRAAYDAHIANNHTKKFRETLFPWLGSPYDERFNEEFK